KLIPAGSGAHYAPQAGDLRMVSQGQNIDDYLRGSDLAAAYEDVDIEELMGDGSGDGFGATAGPNGGGVGLADFDLLEGAGAGGGLGLDANEVLNEEELNTNGGDTLAELREHGFSVEPDLP